MAFGRATSSFVGHRGVFGEGRLYLRPGLRVVKLGDSITTSFPYLEQAEPAIIAFYVSQGLMPPLFIDSGVNGDATNDIDNQARVLDHNPDVLIYMIGFNDVGNIPEEQSVSGYTATWDTCRAARPNLRCMGVSPWVRLTPGQGTDGGFAAGFQSLRTQFANVCRARGIPFVDIRAQWDAAGYTQQQALAYNNDGAHPTPLGRALLSSLVMQQIVLLTN